METSKAKDRRLKSGWFEKYAPADQSGIDIGCNHDVIHESFRKWDFIFGDGDATIMENVATNSYHTVYASHILEHLWNPKDAVARWYKITEPGGHLIIVVPHRDLYEKKQFPPSIWNCDHKHFYLPEMTEEVNPDNKILCLRQVILEAIPNADIVSYEILNDGYVEKPANVHSVGEYSIEAIIKKKIQFDLL